MRFLSIAALLTLSLVSVQAAFSDDCAALQSQLNIPNAVVNIVSYVQNGTNLTLVGNDPTCTRNSQLIYGGDICRIAMNYNTSDSSQTQIEVWLPANWNGRFLMTGNGGISGCLQYEDVAYGNSFGFATVGTNNGHNGTGGTAFANSTGVVQDFAYRALRTGITVGKNITRQFYAKNFTYSYYLGCSTGGRQGMKMVQDYQDEFDGVVAGAPAFDFNNLISWSGWLGVLGGFDNTSSSFVQMSQWVAVHNEILRQCDGLDGAVDGIIEDPSLCVPKISPLICNATTTNTSSCLNGAQATRVRRILSDVYGLNGTLVFPRLQPGAEVSAMGFFYSGQPFPYTRDWYRYALYHNASWMSQNMTLQDIANNQQADLFGVSTFNPNLQPFNSSGKKLIMWHGQQDQLITSLNTQRYYENMAANMSKSPSELDSFVRFFRLGGVAHCSGGPGAWDIGQKYFGRSNATNTPDNNVLLAIMRWVEQGQAPTTITGYNYGNRTTAGPIAFSRNHCKYPTRNVHVGPGNYTDPSSWMCM